MPFVKVPKDKLEDLKILNKEGRVIFDWSLQDDANSETSALVLDGEISGLVEFQKQNGTHRMWKIEVAKEYRGSFVAGKLMAYVGLESLNNGNDGFVYFMPKDALREYYIENYEARPYFKGFLHFDTNATKKLIEKYLTDEDFCSKGVL